MLWARYEIWGSLSQPKVHRMMSLATSPRAILLLISTISSNLQVFWEGGCLTLPNPAERVNCAVLS